LKSAGDVWNLGPGLELKLVLELVDIQFREPKSVLLEMDSVDELELSPPISEALR
jgi:hypothetical protein